MTAADSLVEVEDFAGDNLSFRSFDPGKRQTRPCQSMLAWFELSLLPSSREAAGVRGGGLSAAAARGVPTAPHPHLPPRPSARGEGSEGIAGGVEG